MNDFKHLLIILRWNWQASEFFILSISINMIRYRMVSRSREIFIETFIETFTESR